LPSKLNELIGLEPKQIIKTYDGSDVSLINLKFSISEKGISGELLNSPLQKIQGIDVIDSGDMKGWISVDLDKIFGEKDLGLFSFQMPIFLFDADSGSFKVAGGYKIDEKRGLKLPLTPVKKFLELIKLSDVAQLIPDGIPVKSIDLIDRNSKKINIGELDSLPKGISDIIKLFEDIIGKLPESFLDYMSIKIPQEMEFKFEISAGGSVCIYLDTEVKGLANKSVKDKDNQKSEPLQFLIPICYPPQLIGIKLRKIGLGTLGSQVKLELDVEIDSFDLISMASALIIPESGLEFLPDRHKLHQKIVIKDLVMLIIYQSGIPIPIPLFYEELSFSRLGIEGLGVGTSIKLPKPEIGIKDILAKFTGLKDFFTKSCDEENGLMKLSGNGNIFAPIEEGNQTNKKDLIFSYGPLYIQLPSYLGKSYELKKAFDNNNPKYDIWAKINSLDKKNFASRKQLKKAMKEISVDVNEAATLYFDSAEQVIGTKKTYSISAMDLLCISLNSIKLAVNKKPFINYFISKIPIENRLGDIDISLFGIFDYSAAWALTTPYEFANVAYSELKKKYGGDNDLGNNIKKESTTNELLELLNENETGCAVSEQDDGLALFLQGGIRVAEQFILETAIGMVIGGPEGFRTGISFYGIIADIIETRLLGFIKISPNSKTQVFRLLGKSSLYIFKRQVLYGLFELTDQHLKIEGMLDLFPHDFLLKLSGYVKGYIGTDKFLLSGGINLELGALRAHANLKIEVEKDLLFELQLLFLSFGINLRFKKMSGDTNGIIELDLKLNALQIIDFISQLQVNYNAQGATFLKGQSLLNIGISDMLITRIETYLSGCFDPKNGYMKIQGELAPDSYLLGPSCRINGGFAFYSWFNTGDFVLTIGGYHPHFQKPAHYPVVPRVGFNWQIDKHTSFKGSAYFALTPSCIMAGGNLCLNYQNGNLRAWLSADVNILAQWRPLFYSMKVNVNIGVSYKLKVLFVKKVLSASFNTELELWGPPIGGKIHVDWKIISFSISFGHSRNSIENFMDWEEFVSCVLPKNKPIVLIKLEKGIISEKEEEKEKVTSVDAQLFQFTTESAVPVNQLALNSGEIMYKDHTGDYLISIRPMALRGITITQVLIIEKDGIPIDIQSEEMPWIVEPIQQSLPEALWGEPIPAGETPRPSSQLLPNRMTGLRVLPPHPDLGTDPKVVDISKNIKYTLIESTGIMPLYVSEVDNSASSDRKYCKDVSRKIRESHPMRDRILSLLEVMMVRGNDG